MPLIKIAEYLPDRAAYENPGATRLLNVVPVASGVAPLGQLTAQTTQALAARVMGAFGCFAYSGTAYLFVADATTIRRLESGGLTFDDVSRTVGGAYGATERWSFCQFGDRVLAADGVDAMQSYVMGSSIDFGALGGSSPVARYLATIKSFAVAGAVAGALARVQWCAIEDPTDWVVSATTLADYQDMPTGGDVKQVVGGEFGTVLQRRRVVRMTFVGPPLVFQFDELLKDVGCSASGSVAAYGNDCFFLSDTGFKLLLGMSQLVDIGKDAVDETFRADFDANYPDRVTATFDPVNEFYMVAYPGSGHSGGTPNKGLIFSKRLGRWTHFEQEVESLFAAVQAASAYTLDTLDLVSSSIDALAASLDSPLWTGESSPFLAAFTTAHKLGLFSGAPMLANFDTTEGQLISGRRATVTSARPIADAATMTAQLGVRNLQSESVTWGPEVELNAYGRCPVFGDARYHRLRIAIPAGTPWTLMQGVDEIEMAAGAVI